MRGSGIFGVVDAMAESGNLLFLRQHFLDVLDRVGTRTVDRFENVEHGLIGSAVQWAFKAADGGDDGRVHIRKCGGGDSCSKSRSIELVVGVQDQGDVKRAFGGLRGLLAVQHQQKIRGVGKRAVGFYNRLSFPNAIVAGHDHSNLRSQTNRFANVGLVIVIASHPHRRTKERIRRCAVRPWDNMLRRGLAAN